MRFPPVIAIVGILVAGWPVRAVTQRPDSGQMAADERAYIASKIYSTVRQYFAHREGLPPTFDLDSVYRTYLSRAMASSDRREFSLASHEFVASLHNGHSSFRDRWLRGHFGQPLGFTALPVSGQWVVNWSVVGGLDAGDVLQAVDGEPVESFFQRQKKYIPASTERWARHVLFGHLFDPPILFPLRFTLTLNGGRVVTVDRVSGPQRLPPTPRVEARLIENSTVGYLRIASFDGSPAYEDSALVALAELRKAWDLTGLVVDVRDNDGGNTPARLTRALMDRPFRWFLEATPMDPAVYQLTQPMLRWGPGTALPDSNSFKGRLVILSDAGCFSSCEDFVMPFKDNGRATIVGDTTGGSSGQPFFHGFPNGMAIWVGAKREYFPDGRQFEGVGIAPDILVRPSPSEIRRGSDRALERAIEVARTPRE